MKRECCDESLCPFFVALLSSLSIGVARAEPGNAKLSSAPDTSACVQAYEQAQEQRQSGQLLEARGQLEVCARAACPKFIRSDCLTWDDELRAEIPTVVFAARSSGRDLSDVQVSLGERLLSARIDGEAIELDPGAYDFEFQLNGMPPVTQHVLISRGEKNRLLRAEFEPAASGPAPDSGTSPPPNPQRSWALPVIFGGVGVLGLAGFAGFGALGHSAESQLEKTCSPHCDKDQIANVRPNTPSPTCRSSSVSEASVLRLISFFAKVPRRARLSACRSTYERPLAA